AKVWAKTVAKSTTYFTDFVKSKAAQGQYVAYFSAPILDHDGNLIAIAAMQVSPQLVTKIVDSRVGMGETGESYLLGLDATSNQFTLRSDIVTMGNGRYVVGFRLGYDLDYWTDARSAGDTGGQGTYIDSAGRPVLVTFNRIQVPGYDWYLISKINQDEVTTPITRIYQALTIITAMIFVLICFVAIKFSNSVTSPLFGQYGFRAAHCQRKAQLLADH
ncbi:cache domain-containing protein, partial [Vibrio vulnificus]|uniref:cache domain-containing protein n=1 Tax=Vibrio vulnificus TaxID=672 RepID=UPI0005769C50